jgi:alpha-N-arabinofuranosidase
MSDHGEVMTASARIAVDRHRVRGTIDPRIYGQFVEHVGRAIYGGVFEPGSPLSDAEGYRADVLELARELGPTVLRWPGGNFASGYHWRDGIGPVAHRPVRRDLAWGALEPNTFGTEEFLEYCRRLGAEPYLNLNLSTGTVDEALSWLEYCNGSDPLPEVVQRRQGPHPAPHGVPVWGLGNENYGWWQHGHSTAADYAAAAREWAKLLHWADPSIALVAVGAPDPDWNWTVLKALSPFADYLSLHFYWRGDGDEYHEVLSGPARAEQEIEAAWGMARAAAAATAGRRPLRIAVDEWGVWYRAGIPDQVVTEGLPALLRQGFSARSGVDTRFEEPFDLKDALTVASWLHVLWRHPEKVGLATQAQMVNVIAPIHAHAGGVVRHTVFHPLAVARREAGPVALDVLVQAETEVAAPGYPGGSLPAVDAGGTIDPSTGRIHLSVVNRERDEEVVVCIDGVGGRARRIELWHEDPMAGNDPAHPDRVTTAEEVVDVDGPLHLPPHSHTTLVFD